jgi:hypothetical protein
VVRELSRWSLPIIPDELCHWGAPVLRELSRLELPKIPESKYVHVLF